MNILHISDLHFGPPYVPAVGEALIRIAGQLEADVTVVAGDLTQRAKRQQFADAKEFLDRLPKRPTVVIPGNHDVPLYRLRERFTDPYRLYREYISPDLNMVLKTDEAVMVGLNSTAPRSAISNGRLHHSKLEYCREAFENAPPDVARIVIAHHHFAPAPDYLHDQTMPKAKRAMNLFVDLGVELILGGHLHRAYIGNSLDFYPGNHRDRGIVIVQSGTATSRRGRGREREKNSFNYISMDERMYVITHYMYFDEQDQFLPLSRHHFPRPGHNFIYDRAEPDDVAHHNMHQSTHA